MTNPYTGDVRPAAAQYAGLTADERVLAAADPHMSGCDAPRIEDCDSCEIRLTVMRRHLGALTGAGRLVPEGAVEEFHTREDRPEVIE